MTPPRECLSPNTADLFSAGPAMLRNHGLHGRVIVHADLDCFYAQVSKSNGFALVEGGLSTRHDAEVVQQQLYQQ